MLTRSGAPWRRRLLWSVCLSSFVMPRLHAWRHAGLLRSPGLRPVPRLCRSMASSAAENPADAPPAIQHVDLLAGETNRTMEQSDHLVSALSEDGEVSIKVLRNTETVRELIRRQGLTELTADALGRAMACTTLLSNGLKDKGTIQLVFAGSGPLKGMLTIGESDGAARGYVTEPTLELPLKDGRDGVKLQDVPSAIGPGELKVVKDHPSWLGPYQGIVELRTATVAEDVAVYLKNSEQRRTAIGAGVAFHRDDAEGEDAAEAGVIDRLAASGGFFVELLPGCSDEAAKQVEQNVFRLVARAESPATFLAAGTTPKELVEQLMVGLGVPKQLLMSRAYFHCKCSMDKLTNALRMLPPEDIEDILEKGEDVEAKCELCGMRYTMTAEEVQRDVVAKK